MQQNMAPSNDREKILIEKILTLSSEKITRVADFIDFISQKDSGRRLIQIAKRLTEPAFQKYATTLRMTYMTSYSFGDIADK